VDIYGDLQSRALLAALRASFIGYGDLWVAYFGLGGKARETEVEAYLQGLLSLPSLERDLLAEAANELIDALPPLPRAAYSDDPRLTAPTGISPPSPD
jgi:hypothetical protein